jgi:ADP-heptose:LPS heptosyltransferase
MTASLPHGARVLLVRLSALGDVLFALETLASLKRERPDVRAEFLIEDRFASVLDGHPQIDRLWIYPRRELWRLPTLLWRLRRARFDAVLDLHGIQKSAFHVLAARARHKLGYAAPGAREGAHRFYREAITLPDPLPHRAERGLWLLRALGLRGESARPVLAEPPAPVDVWRGAARPRVVVHPGVSAFADFKRWPAERYAELVAHLASRGISVAVSHGPGEAELAAAVSARASDTRRIDGAALGLRGLARVFADSDVVVAGDTGPLHLAAAAGARVVALFGPKEPAFYGPRGDGHRVLFADVPCRPCTRRTCASPQCVLGIPVARVADVVEAVLAEGARA